MIPRRLGRRGAGGSGARNPSTPRIDALLADYRSSHRTRGNLVCHAFGIGLIVFGVLSMLHAIPLIGGFTASEALLVAALLVYALLDVPLALAVIGFAGALDIAARAIDSAAAGAGAFAAGWILQAVGHGVYERNSPAFFRNLLHLLIGPAFLVNEVLHIRRPPPASPVSRT